jgi:FkbM family methyltransferase
LLQRRAIHAAVADCPGTMKIPNPNYLAPAGFGSLELKPLDKPEFIGQAIDYSEDKMVDVPVVSLDSFNFPRLDMIKIDVEGMELDVLAGAANCIAAKHPILIIEFFKTDQDALRAWLEQRDYFTIPVGLNFVAVHKGDKCFADLQFVPQQS